jgi:hypothetical protein
MGGTSRPVSMQASRPMSCVPNLSDGPKTAPEQLPWPNPRQRRASSAFPCQTGVRLTCSELVSRSVTTEGPCR